MAPILKVVITLPILLLLFATSISGDQGPLATSSSIARRELDVKCTCTTCENPCGDYSSPPPPVIYASPPPPEIYYYPPPPPVLPPPAVVYNSPPPPYTPVYPGTPYCPPPPSAPTICCGGGGTPSNLPSWMTPPGELYPVDPGYHPNGATSGHVAWWVGLFVGGLVCVWW